MLSYQYRMDETTAPTEAQMKLAIAQTLSLPFAYNAPVVVLNFEVDEDGGITGNFKDAARPRVFSFELDGESVSYSPFKPGKMDSLDSEDGVIEWEEFSAGYSYRVDAGIGTGKKPQCVKPTAYNCGSACINVNKNCKSNAKDNVSKDRLKKLKGLAMSYYKEFEKLDKTERGSDKQKEFGDKSNQASRKRLALMEQAKGKKGVKSEESQAKPKAESKKPSGQKSTAKKTTEPKVKPDPKVEPKPEVKSSPKSKANPFYSDEPIKDYDTFKKEIPKELARVNFEYNMDGLIPISKMREELKGRVNEKDFDEWMKQSFLDDETDTIILSSQNPDNKPDPKGIKSSMGSTYDHVLFRDENAIKKAEKEIKRKPGQITDLEEFSKLAIEVYDKLNKEKDYNDLIPIYQIRRAMGDKVSRGDFNNLMFEMQANDVFQFSEGSVEDSARDKIQDSLNNEASGIRTYAQKIKPGN
jgi:hypothetical protein